VWLNFDPQAGHEQAGRRPALVLSPTAYNDKTGMALVCPVTSSVKGYPFEVALPQDSPVFGVVLADQIKALDWRSRNADFACLAPTTVVEEVLGKLNALLR
jgi:mRNA interferase MazF